MHYFASSRLADTGQLSCTRAPRNRSLRGRLRRLNGSGWAGGGGGGSHKPPKVTLFRFNTDSTWHYFASDADSVSRDTTSGLQKAAYAASVGRNNTSEGVHRMVVGGVFGSGCKLCIVAHSCLKPILKLLSARVLGSAATRCAETRRLGLELASRGACCV